MNDRERMLAILNYEPYDRVPVVHFGYWDETLEKWAAEGHISKTLAAEWYDENHADRILCGKLGFDFGWGGVFGPHYGLMPAFRRRVVADLPEGGRHVLNADGVIVLEKDDAVSIPAEIEHLLKGRPEWERLFRHRAIWSEERLARARVHERQRGVRFDRGGRERLAQETDKPRGLWCGSLIGIIRNWVGVVGLSYLTADDPALLDEMIETVSEVIYQGTLAALNCGIRFDYGHFWEDICFKNGPLVNPRWFAANVAPHYGRVTKLLNNYGVSVVSVDCDGKIDRLIPAWLANGVNTMFPIEVGTWEASIAPWRREYGRELCGVGGMDKRVFSRDYAAVDAEIERLRPLVELGGYIPCPDHRIAPDAKWENVQYYCDQMRKAF